MCVVGPDMAPRNLDYSVNNKTSRRFVIFSLMPNREQRSHFWQQTIKNQPNAMRLFAQKEVRLRKSQSRWLRLLRTLTECGRTPRMDLTLHGRPNKYSQKMRGKYTNP